MSYKYGSFEIGVGGPDDVELGDKPVVNVAVVLDWVTEVKDGWSATFWWGESGHGMIYAVCGGGRWGG